MSKYSNVTIDLESIKHYLTRADEFKDFYNSHYAVINNHFNNAYSCTPKTFAMILLKFFGLQIENGIVTSINFDPKNHKHLAAIYAFVDFLKSEDKTFSFDNSILKKLINEKN